MIIKIYQSFLNDAVQIYTSEVSLEDPTTATATGLFSRFTLGYGDYEPSMILQFLINDDDPIDLSPPAGSSSWSFSSALGFKSTLKNLISAETNQLKTSLDLRYNNKCTLSVNSEKMYVTDVRHDFYLNLSFLSVERRGTRLIHHPETEIRVVRSTPTVTMLEAAAGKVKITWSSTDTDAPGDYELEVTLSRLEGSHQVRFSVLPLLLTVLKDYNLE
jgi:hypothetical protein